MLQVSHARIESPSVDVQLLLVARRRRFHGGIEHAVLDDKVDEVHGASHLTEDGIAILARRRTIGMPERSLHTMKVTHELTNRTRCRRCLVIVVHAL